MKEDAMDNPHGVLTSVFSQYWKTPLHAFTSQLYSKDKSKEIDPLLLSSFKDELLAFGVKKQIADEYMLQLGASAVVQTTHHVTPTNGPTFLGADVIALAGLHSGSCYLVGTISGLPFSNPALSGCLLFKKARLAQILTPSSKAFNDATRQMATSHPSLNLQPGSRTIIPSSKVSLIPSRLRNGLVYSATVPEKLISLWPSLTEACRAFMTEPVEDQLYSYWACRSCAALQQKVLGTTKILYFDLNRVIARYLQKALAVRGHPLRILLLDQAVAMRVAQAFNRPTLFLEREPSGGTPRVIAKGVSELSWWKANSTEGAFAEEMIEGLASGVLCPSMFLVIFALKFLNGIRCLGGYRQIEYTEDFRKRWQDLDLGLNLDLEPDGETSLTTGRILDDDGLPLFPLDLFLEDSVIAWKQLLDRPMSYFWEPIAHQMSIPLP